MRMATSTLPDRETWGTQYSSYDDVQARLHARRSGPGRRRTQVSFGLLGRVLWSVPVLLAVAFLLYLGLRLGSIGALGVLVLLAGAGTWYVRDLWRPRR